MPYLKILPFFFFKSKFRERFYFCCKYTDHKAVYILFYNYNNKNTNKNKNKQTIFN